MVFHTRRLLVLSILFLAAVPGIVLAEPSVSLSSPDDGNISLSGNVTFECNATGDSLTGLSLFTDIGGDWAGYGSVYYGELTEDGNTLLLCNFTGYACSDSTGTDSGTSITAGKIGSGVFVDGSDTLTFSSAGNLDVTEGSVEMWVKPEGNLSGEHWLFIAAQSPSVHTTEYRIWIDDDILEFRFIDEYESPSRVWTSVSNWNASEWHHVAATWKASTNSMELYVDSSTSGNSYNIGSLGYMGSAGSTMYLGSYKLGTGQFNGTIDELRISDSQKTGSEINDSYMTGLTNVTSAGEQWTVNGISDGEYVWNCRATDNESGTGWNDTNRTLYVDASSPPSINSITTIPNTSDELDPDVNINVTANLSDPSGVNTSILIYRKQGTSTWSNVTMSNISLQDWRGSFSVPPQDPGTWEYAVWNNDSNGFSNQSAIMTVVVEDDYSWNSSPSTFGDVYIDAGQTGLLGQIELNNTGEYNLYFNITSTWTDTTFNISTPEDFNLSAGQSMTVNVTVISSMTPYQYLVNITIGCKTAGATPDSAVINASLISYIGGPNILATITSSPVSVSQSQSNMVFNATIKNIGNETANDTWVNWTFPTGWSNASGNLTYFAGNITAGSTFYSNLVVSTSSSAAAGVSQVYLNATSNQTYNGSDSTLVGVSCSSSDGVCGSGCTYLTDSDCSAPSGGDGGSSSGTVVSGGGRASYYRLDLRLPERLDLFRGDIEDVEVVVMNTNNIAFPELILSSEGYRSTLISLYSGIQNETVEASSEMPFKLRISVPGYMAYGEYPVIITATAYGGVNITVEGSATIRLFVHSVDENETISLFQEAQEAIGMMNYLGIPTNRTSRFLETASSYLDVWDYDNAKELSMIILEYKNSSLAARSMLEELDESIWYAERYGLSLPETSKLKSLAYSALAREDFQRAEERSESALLTLAVETGTLLPAFMFIENNWLLIVLSVAGISVFLFFGRRVVIMSLIERRIRRLVEENDVLERLISECGSDYFIKKSMSKGEYEKSLDEYSSRYSDNKRKEIRLSVRKMLLKSRSRKSAERRRTEMLRELMVDTQNRYFKERKISRTVYNSTMKEISREIADSGNKTLKVAVSVMVALLILPAAVSATPQQDALDAINAAVQHISEMESLGLGTEYANGTLNEARFLYNEGYYAGAQSLAEEVSGIKESAIRVDALVDEVESKLYDVRFQGIDVSGPEGLFNEAMESVSLEDFVSAESLLEEAYEGLDELEERASLERALESSDFTGIIVNNWEWFFLFPGAFALCFLATRKLTSKAFIRKKIRRLEGEVESISAMIKDIQGMYFHDNVLGRTEYESRMDRYNERLVDVKKNMRVLRKRLG